MTDLPEPYTTVGSLLGNIGAFTAKGFGLRRGDPLYTATQMREYRNQALEEAAKVCEHGVLGHGECADKIRALKEQK